MNTTKKLKQYSKTHPPSQSKPSFMQFTFRNQRLHARQTNLFSFPSLCNYFNVPLSVAAKTLGVSSSHLKNGCRRVGIAKWPYRKLGRIVNELVTMCDSIREEENPIFKQGLVDKKNEFLKSSIESCCTECFKFEPTREQKRDLCTTLIKHLSDVSPSSMSVIGGEEELSLSPCNSSSTSPKLEQQQQQNQQQIEQSEQPEPLSPSILRNNNSDNNNTPNNNNNSDNNNNHVKTESNNMNNSINYLNNNDNISDNNINNNNNNICDNYNTNNNNNNTNTLVERDNNSEKLSNHIFGQNINSELADENNDRNFSNQRENISEIKDFDNLSQLSSISALNNVSNHSFLEEDEGTRDSFTPFLINANSNSEFSLRNSNLRNNNDNDIDNDNNDNDNINNYNTKNNNMNDNNNPNYNNIYNAHNTNYIKHNNNNNFNDNLNTNTNNNDNNNNNNNNNNNILNNQLEHYSYSHNISNNTPTHNQFISSYHGHDTNIKPTTNSTEQHKFHVPFPQSFSSNHHNHNHHQSQERPSYYQTTRTETTTNPAINSFETLSSQDRKPQHQHQHQQSTRNSGETKQMFGHHSADGKLKDEGIDNYSNTSHKRLEPLPKSENTSSSLLPLPPSSSSISRWSFASNDMFPEELENNSFSGLSPLPKMSSSRHKGPSSSRHPYFSSRSALDKVSIDSLTSNEESNWTFNGAGGDSTWSITSNSNDGHAVPSSLATSD